MFKVERQSISFSSFLDIIFIIMNFLWGNRNLCPPLPLFWIIMFCLSNSPNIKCVIKSDFGKCTRKEITQNFTKETCYIEFKDNKSIKYIKKMQRKSNMTCKVFRRSDYNKSTPSLVYMEAYGGTGNQLTAYGILYQLRYLIQLRSLNKTYLVFFLILLIIYTMTFNLAYR